LPIIIAFGAFALLRYSIWSPVVSK